MLGAVRKITPSFVKIKYLTGLADCQRAGRPLAYWLFEINLSSHQRTGCQLSYPLGITLNTRYSNTSFMTIG